MDNAAAAHLEVWAYKNGKIEKVYTPDVSVAPHQAYVSFAPFSGVYGVLVYDKDSVNETIATVATTLEQLKSKDSDDAQVGYEAVSATQDVDFTAAVGEGPLDPSPDDTCQITATWTYPQVKGQGVGVAKFNKDMVQLVADTLEASKQASMDDEDSRVTMMYTAEIVSIDGDIACVRTFTDSYQPPYRSERVTRSAYYNLKTGEQVSLEDSLAQHGALVRYPQE